MSESDSRVLGRLRDMISGRNASPDRRGGRIYQALSGMGEPMPVPGAPGKDGQAGRDGKDGERGATGPAGKDGRDGIDGAPGEQGPAGRDGRDGVDGASGADGRNGRDGIDGAPGASGKDGRDGADGLPGKDGERGPTGAVGPTGPAGKDGVNGKDGTIGPTGAVGPAGPAGKDGAPGALLQVEQRDAVPVPAMLSLLGSVASVDVPVTWATPFPTASYTIPKPSVSTTSASLIGKTDAVVVSQSAAGCVVRVSTTAVLAAGTSTLFVWAYRKAA